MSRRNGRTPPKLSQEGASTQQRPTAAGARPPMHRINFLGATGNRARPTDCQSFCPAFLSCAPENVPLLCPDNEKKATKKVDKNRLRGGYLGPISARWRATTD